MTPDLTGKIIGFREWAGDNSLESTGVGGHWGRGVNVARCSQAHAWDHLSPGHDCQCGLYALHEVPEAYVGPGPWTGAQEMGAIAAWGKVEVHPNGFRAQYAEIIALGFNRRWPTQWVKNTEEFAADYGVPAVEVEDLKQFALNYGSPVPKDLYPAQGGTKDLDPLVTIASARQAMTAKQKAQWKQLGSRLRAGKSYHSQHYWSSGGNR